MTGVLSRPRIEFSQDLELFPVQSMKHEHALPALPKGPLVTPHTTSSVSLLLLLFVHRRFLAAVKLHDICVIATVACGDNAPI